MTAITRLEAPRSGVLPADDMFFEWSLKRLVEEAKIGLRTADYRFVTENPLSRVQTSASWMSFGCHDSCQGSTHLMRINDLGAA
jgi:hypothetical protein